MGEKTVPHFKVGREMLRRLNGGTRPASEDPAQPRHLAQPTVMSLDGPRIESLENPEPLDMPGLRQQAPVSAPAVIAAASATNEQVAAGRVCPMNKRNGLGERGHNAGNQCTSLGSRRQVW